MFRRLVSADLTFLLFRSVQAMGCGLFVLGHALVEDLPVCVSTT